MISAQKPNQYQLSIAQQFVQHFPFVNIFISEKLKTMGFFIGYRTFWDLFSTKSNHEK
jgi:hypothetical protein